MLHAQVADLYGIRASLVDGGEVQGAGTAWICPEVYSLIAFAIVMLTL